MGKSDHTEVQDVYIPKRLFTTQRHMEFDEKMVKRQLQVPVEIGAVHRNDAEEAQQKAEWMHDGFLIATAVLRFFHGDDGDDDGAQPVDGRRVGSSSDNGRFDALWTA